MAFTDDRSLFDGEGEEEEATDDYSSYWQNVPDPPTPEPEAGVAVASAGAESAIISIDEVASVERQPRRRHNRKRDSFAFRDVTNRQDQEVLNRGRNRSSLAKNPGSSVKPSTSTTDSLRIGDEEDACSDRIIEIEGGEETVEKRRKKRKTRRQSLLLPSDDGSAEFQSTFPNKTNGKNETSIVNARSDCAIINKHVNTSGASDQTVLLELVRKYCSLPVECRANSKEANAIESLSGYPMPGKVRPVMDGATTREEFILRVNPIVRQMEYRKKKDTADTKLATQCEAKKIGKGGYFYFDVNSGEQIQADEYKRRYSAMLDERRQKQKGRVEECSEPDPVSQPNNNLVSIEAKKSNRSDDSNMDLDQSVNMDDSMMSLDGSVSSEDEKQSPSVETTPSKDEKSNALSTLLDDSHANEDSSSYATDSPNETQSDSEGANEPSQSDDSRDSHPLLPDLPASNDPRVLAARKKLSCAITAALSIYSHEILAIEESNNAEAPTIHNN